MKKQFLILATLALFAGISAFGQALPGSDPRGTNCVDGPLNPIAGKPYTYQASATPGGGNFTFWATKNFNFIQTVAGVTTTNIATRLTTPTDLLATSANYATANPQDNVTITWSDAVLAGTTAAAPTFVAAHYAALPTNCSDNFKAWSITPIKAFTVDVLNIENATSAPLAYDAEDDQCNDIVRGAVYNAGTSSMEYDYGTQVLYYEVVAANFTNEYDLTLTMTGLHAVQTPVIEYTYDPPAWTPATVWTDITSDNTIETTETNTNTGVSVYVRVTITNDNYEGVADRPVTLTVDAVNSVGEWDIENNTTSNPGPLCNPGTLNDGMDIAVQVLKARPTLTPVVPTPFVPGNEQN